MSATILLHGGRLRIVDSRNDEYFKRLTRDLSDGDKVLFVGFAQDDKAKKPGFYEKEESSRQKYYERDKQYILAQTDKNITVVNATLENFKQELSESKSVHITGGNTALLTDTIKQYTHFIEMIQGKCVGGSSAGAMLFAARYWNGEMNEVMSGLGTLPMALMCHYKSEEFNCTDAQLDILISASTGLELIALQECEWVERGI